MPGESVERRLAAIMACDMVGFSRLMGSDEEGTLSRLKVLRDQTLAERIGANRGRIVKTTGDGVLAEFTSVVDAVRCAVEIQEEINRRNSASNEEQRINFRIGINLGDIIVEGSDIYGDGVNIAARLEGVAEPGGIVVAQTVHDHIRGKLPYGFDDLGEHSLKNIAHPVRVFRVLVPGTTARPGGPAHAASATGAAVRRLSILVLPFNNLSNDPSQEYFGDGITEDLTVDLSRIPGSFVIARNTAFTFKGKAVNVQQAGRELGVRYVLEGSVRRAGEQVRISARLIDTDTSATLWAGRFDANTADLLDLTDDVTSQIARTLDVALTEAESRRGQSERPNNPDAVDLTMRGWSLLYRPHSPEALHEARALFERALKIDDCHGPALVGLAESHVFEIGLMWSKNPQEQLAAAASAVTKALEIDPRYARAHYVQAIVYRLMRRYAQALAALDRALEHDRNLAAALAQRALILVILGRPQEALDPIEHAFRLSPRDSNLSSWLYVLGGVHLHLDNHQASIDAYVKAIAANPKITHNLFLLAAAYGHLRRMEEAKAALAEFLEMRPGCTISMLRGEYWPAGAPSYLEKAEKGAAILRELGMPE
jgi:TolB-like protein/class 3 adenylate cyclase/tetratricopeptide (TPR) repeat protein